VGAHAVDDVRAAMRVLVLARAEAWKRVRREAGVLGLSGVSVLCAAFVLVPWEPSLAGGAVRSVGLAACLALAWGDGLGATLGLVTHVEHGHLPIAPAERRLAVLLAEEATGALSTAVWLLVLASVLGALAGLVLHDAAPAESASAVAAAVVDLVGPIVIDVAVVLPVVVVTAVFAGAAPLVVGGREPLRLLDDPGPRWWGPWLLVATAWVLTGSALVAVVVSLVWALVPDVRPVEDLGDRGVTPVVGREAQWRYRRRGWLGAAVVLAGTELAIRVAPLVVRTLPPSWISPVDGDPTLAATIARLGGGWFATFAVSGVALMDPVWPRPRPVGGAHGVMSRLGHLPIEPSQLIDARAEAILGSVAVTPVVLAWLAITTGLSLDRTLAVGASVLGTGLACAAVSWVPFTRPGGRYGGAVALVVAALLVFAGIVFIDGDFAAFGPGAMPGGVHARVAASVATTLALVPVAAAAWWLARRRWSR
jgi:hypothetical protein